MPKIEKLDLANQQIAKQSRNKTAITGACIMNIILSVAYVIEVIKGTRSISSYSIILIGTIIPCVLSLIVYFCKKESHAIRYIISIGFAFLYGYIMFTTTTNLSFSYVIVIYVILAVYVDTKLSIGLGTYAVLFNILIAVKKALEGTLDAQQITETEIMLACLVLSCVFTIMALSKVSKINQANLMLADKEKRQSEHLLETVLNVADAIVLDIQKTTEETERLRNSIEITKFSMEDLTSNAKKAVSSICKQKQNTDEINHQINEVEAATMSIVLHVKSAEDDLENGKKVINELTQQVRTSQSASTQVAKEMKELQVYADKMQGILSLIVNVSSQTGLLALNASIEAARAGDAGKGFAVVASEISNLASQTNNATTDINQLITNITKSLLEVADSVGGLIQSNELQYQYVNDTEKNFSHIQKSTKDISSQISKLKNKVDIVSDANKMITESIDNVSSVTEEVTAGVSETFEGSKNNLRSVANVVKYMNEINKNTEELRKTKID